MRRRARAISFAIRPDCRPKSANASSLKAAGVTTVVTDGCVRSTGDVLLRTRNSGENEANLFFAPKFAKKRFF
jgi:hypothetical protein